MLKIPRGLFMKKQLVLLLSLLSLFACNSKEEVKIPLFNYQYSENERTKTDYALNRLTTNSLNSMLEDKMSFPVFVYAAGCGSCDNFATVIKDYIRQYKIAFPTITLAQYLRSNINSTLTNSALVFINEGKIFKTIDTILDDVFITSELVSIMNKYTYMTNVNIVNTANLYNQTTGTFSYYEFTSYLSSYENYTGDMLISKFDDLKKENLNLLLIDNRNEIDFSYIYTYLNSNTNVDSIALIDEQLNNDVSYLNSILKENKLGKITYIEFNNNEVKKFEVIS